MIMGKYDRNGTIDIYELYLPWFLGQRILLIVAMPKEPRKEQDTKAMDKLKLVGSNLGQVFNSRCRHYTNSLKRDRLAPQLCLLFWSGGTPVLLACPQVMSLWPT